jgi:hypothetical protein
MSAVDFPDSVTWAQVKEALRALGIDHLVDDAEVGLSLRELHLMPGELEVTVIRTRAAIRINEASTVTARIGVEIPGRGPT